MPASLRPRRSVLFVPGGNPRAIERSRTIPADVIVLDLEDSVLPENKADARTLAANALATGDFGRREVVVRVNALDTLWAASDIAAVVPARPDAILVPKIGRSDDIRRVRAALSAAGATPHLAIWAMMETPLAVLNAGPIGAAALEPGSHLAAMVLGTGDLALDSGMRTVPGRGPMLPWIATCVAAARAFELIIIDGAFTNLDDMAGFNAECQQGRDLGMDGKALIHPKQVDPCNETYSPNADDVAWALTVVAAFERPENAQRAVVTIDGRVVERLHERMARRIVETARVIRSFETA